MKPAVILQTIRDLFRERILYNVLFLSLFLIFVGLLASRLVFGHQHRVILHFGTTIISLTSITLGLTIGSRLFRQDIEQRNIYLPLSRPITRSAFFYSKAFGVSLFLLFNLALLLAVLMGAIEYLQGNFRPMLFEWALLTWIESLLGLGLALALSFLMRPALNIMSCLTFLFLSHNHEQMDLLRDKGNETGLELFSKLTPDGSIFFL
jgi:Cu-processing system permease protein